MVLTNESARHPFRARTVLLHPVDEDPGPMPARVREDVAFFLISFVAGFIIIFGMIA